MSSGGSDADSFGCHVPGRWAGLRVIWWVGTKRSTERPAVHRAAPSRESRVQTASGTTLENPGVEKEGTSEALPKRWW